MVRWRRLTAIAATAIAATVVAPSGVAWADCTGDPPPLQSPSYTTAAVFDQGPDNPRPGDPFADEPRTTIYERYEWAGLHYGTYDLGCGVDFTRSPEAVIGNYVANIGAWITEVGGGISAALHRVASDPPSIFDPVDSQIEQVTDALTSPAILFMGIALLALGVIVVWRSRQAAYHETARIVGWGFLFLTIGLFIMGYPLRAAQAFDGVLSTSIDYVRSELTSGTTGASTPADPGVGISASKHANIAYPAWVDGTFGNGATECADRFADRIFQAGTLTVDEEARAADDPDYAAELKAEKNAAFKATAAEVKEFSEECYMHMIGQRPMPRVGASMVGATSMTVTSAFDILAALMILAGYLSVRLLVMFALPLVVVSIVRPSLMIGIATKVFGTVINALFFGVAVGLFALGQQVLLASSVPSWLAVVIIALSAVLFWKATRSIRRVDPTGQGAAARDKAWGWTKFAALEGWRYWRNRKAAEGGYKDAMDDRDDPDDRDDVVDMPEQPDEEQGSGWVEVEQVRPRGELSGSDVYVGSAGRPVAGALPAGPTGRAEEKTDVEEDPEVVEAEVVDEEENAPLYVGDSDTTVTVEQVRSDDE